jgi:hypothetical protein
MNLQWLICDACGHQLTSEGIGCAVARPRFETPSLNLALGEPDAAAVGRSRFLQWPYCHGNRCHGCAPSALASNPVNSGFDGRSPFTLPLPLVPETVQSVQP